MALKENEVPKQDGGDGGGGGGGGSGSGSGSGSGGSGGAKEMDKYRQVIYSLYGVYSFTSKQRALAEKAKKLKWPPSMYLQMLRREDPRYVRSDDYKNRRRDARLVYQAYRPNAKPSKNFLDAYARSGMNKARLQGKIESTKWFKRQFPGWKAAQAQGQSYGRDPQQYIALREMLNHAMKTHTGSIASPQFHRMMFGSGMNESDIGNNLLEVFGGREALAWATGQTLNPAQSLQAALTKRYGQQQLSAIRQSQRQQVGFMKSELKDFDVGIDEPTGNIVQKRI